MNLRIGSVPALIAFLLEVVRDEGKVEFAFEGGSILRVRDRYFFLHALGPGVSGPCATVAQLVRLEGERKDPKTNAGVADDHEEWHCFGRIWALPGDDAEEVGNAP